ncbi:MAG: hypothetical protein EBU93_04500 [Chlamydiae bacterium]|nr:hypothetical protein [Chlamydiota bacterium]
MNNQITFKSTTKSVRSPDETYCNAVCQLIDDGSYLGRGTNFYKGRYSHVLVHIIRLGNDHFSIIKIDLDHGSSSTYTTKTKVQNRYGIIGQLNARRKIPTFGACEIF